MLTCDFRMIGSPAPSPPGWFAVFAEIYSTKKIHVSFYPVCCFQRVEISNDRDCVDVQVQSEIVPFFRSDCGTELIPANSLLYDSSYNELYCGLLAPGECKDRARRKARHTLRQALKYGNVRIDYETPNQAPGNDRA